MNKLSIKVLTLYDLDAENQPEHSYLNKIIEDLSDKVISFKPKIENYLNITKEMCNDKFRGLVILMSEFYLDDNDKLIELLNNINIKLEEIKQ